MEHFLFLRAGSRARRRRPRPFAYLRQGCLLVALNLPGLVLGADSESERCVAAQGIVPDCGFRRPEDLEVLAPGGSLLVSEYGTLGGAERGRLKHYDPRTRAQRVLYPRAGADGAPDWGAADCPGPPGREFAPHGIHHGPAAGEDRLLVVNHRARESIELFEVMNADDPDSLALRWRGCVTAPEGIWLNDVAGLPGGAFAATHMVVRGTGEEALLRAERTREPTGYVLEWSPAAGWRRLPGTDGGLPNGIEVSDDGTTLFVNEYFGDQTYAFDRASGTRRWQTPVDAPDNLSWATDGRLLVASHHEDLQAIFACNANATKFCPVRFSIEALEPREGHRLTVARGGGADSAMGGATVAVEIGNTLYIGSFVGDRLGALARGTGLGDQEVGRKASSASQSGMDW